MVCHRWVEVLLFPVFVIVVSVTACTKSDSDSASTSRSKTESSKLTVYTVNYPLQYFAERIGGNEVEVSLPAPSDVDPAFWMPDAETIAAYQNADLIILNGATYAKWVGRVSLPESKLVDTSAPFSDRYIIVEDAITHAHGPGGDHAHAGTAFTTWIDFAQAAQQARVIKDAYVHSRPDDKATFERNYAALEKDLVALDEAIETMVAPMRDLPLVASHPVYQYFARRYGLNIESVLWEPGEAPSERHWEELRVRLADHPAKWMIWEGEPNSTSVERLAAMGIGSTVFDPCGNTPSHGDFMSVMRGNVENLKTVFE
jgi:zinc transport system substrate-binding protein